MPECRGWQRTSGTESETDPSVIPSVMLPPLFMNHFSSQRKGKGASPLLAHVWRDMVTCLGHGASNFQTLGTK